MSVIFDVIVLGTVAAGIAVLVLTRSKHDGPSAPAEARFVAQSDSYTAIEINAHLRISYADASGASTTRDVLVHRYDWDGDGYIVGHCSLRKAERTFRLSRVTHMLDLDTGEVVTKGYRRFLRSKRIR